MGAIQDAIEDEHFFRKRVDADSLTIHEWTEVLEALNKVPDLHHRTFGVRLTELKDYAKARIFDAGWVRSKKNGK